MRRAAVLLAAVALALIFAVPAATADLPPRTSVNEPGDGGGCAPGNVMYLYNGSGYDIFYCVYPYGRWVWIGRT